MPPTKDRPATSRWTRAGIWTLALGVSAVVAGPLLGFGLLAALLAVAALVVAVAAHRRDERSWALLVGAGLAVAALCFLPFTSGPYPYTGR